MNSVVANCIGYAFEQCYSSSIEVTRVIEKDGDHLAALKELAAEYEKACEGVSDEDLGWKLGCSINREMLEKVKAAKSLEEIY